MKKLPKNKFHQSQRGYFAGYLYNAMCENKHIWCLTGDLGYKVLDNIRRDFPERFLNCGASEQAMLDISCGLATEGNIPFVYSITPFLIYRPFETLRTYINHEKLNVKLIGSGRDRDYEHDGISHYADDVSEIVGTLPNILQFYPTEKEQVEIILETMCETKLPCFLSLQR